jgi:hypothetical protein
MKLKPCPICEDAQNPIFHVSFNAYEVGSTYLVIQCHAFKHGRNPYLVDKELVSGFTSPLDFRYE